MYFKDKTHKISVRVDDDIYGYLLVVQHLLGGKNMSDTVRYILEKCKGELLYDTKTHINNKLQL